MRIYLLRHGTAEPQKEGLDDQDRALVPKGRKQTKRAAEFIKSHLTVPKVVITSPVKRAAQTTKTLVKTLKLKKPALEDERLSPSSTVEKAVDCILEQTEECVLVVSHEPLVSKITHKLVGAGTRANFDIRKAGLVEIELTSTDPLRCTLLGLVRPAYLS